MFANSIHLIDYFNIFVEEIILALKKLSLGYNQSVLICRILYDPKDIELIMPIGIGCTLKVTVPVVIFIFCLLLKN